MRTTSRRRPRLHRIGQVSKVTYLHLLAQDTVDERVYDVLKQKKSVVDDVVDNWRKLFLRRKESSVMMNYVAATNRCPECGCVFRTMDDEFGMHPCPRCGLFPP